MKTNKTYEEVYLINTRCDTRLEVFEMIAMYFHDYRDREEVTVINTEADGSEVHYHYTKYDPCIIAAINDILQVNHFGGVLRHSGSPLNKNK